MGTTRNQSNLKRHNYLNTNLNKKFKYSRIQTGNQLNANITSFPCKSYLALLFIFETQNYIHKIARCRNVFLVHLKSINLCFFFVDIMNKKPRLAWELYLKMETSGESFSLLQLIANDCYKVSLNKGTASHCCIS